MITDRSTAVLAHGLGGSTDLPIPLSYALIGAAWALTFTFAVVALAWRRPRFDPDKPGRPLLRRVTTLVDAPATRWAVAIGNPFDHLPSLPVRAGTVAVLAVLLGSTAFDSFSATPQWRGFVDDHTDSAATATLLRTAGLLVFAAVVAGAFWLAARATGGVNAQRRRELPGLMAHSLIPIVIGATCRPLPHVPRRTRTADVHPAVRSR